MRKRDLFGFRDDPPGPDVILPRFVIRLEFQDGLHHNRLRTLIGQWETLPYFRVCEIDFYHQTLMREKKFTFREIAEWLDKKFGIEADHNAVYRAYTKSMDPLSAHYESEKDDKMEYEEALAEATANGTITTCHPQPAKAVQNKPTQSERAEAAAHEKPKAKGKKRR